MKKTTVKKTTSRLTVKPVEKLAETDSCSCGGNCGCNGMCACDCGGWGLALLRIIVGGAFLWHGITKLIGFSGTAGFFTQLFGSAGPILAGIVAATETIGGLLLILGFFTRYAAYALATILVVAIVWAKKFAWPAIELDLVLVGALIALAWNGPGKYALQKRWCSC